MSAVSKVIVSRRKSIEVIKAELAGYEQQLVKLGVPRSSPAGQAIVGLMKVKEARLLKLQEELQALLLVEELEGTAQLDLAKAAPAAEHPAPGPVAGKARQGPTK